jgi:flagellar biosynthesis activator protein FlaF
MICRQRGIRMNATLAHTSYQSARATLNSRAIEFQVFSQITSRLDYYHNRTRETHEPYFCQGLAEALYDNKRLWSAITVDIAQPAHPYPLDLKEKLISLAHFVRNHTNKVLKNESTAEVLIQINESIIAGLKGQQSHEGDGHGRV